MVEFLEYEFQAGILRMGTSKVTPNKRHGYRCTLVIQGVNAKVNTALIQTAEKLDKAQLQRQVGSLNGLRICTWAAIKPIQTNLKASVIILTALTMAQEVERFESYKKIKRTGSD